MTDDLHLFTEDGTEYVLPADFFAGPLKPGTRGKAGPRVYTVVTGTPDEIGNIPVDATFIANAPTDIAYLLERVRAWKELAEEAIEEFEDARGYASAYFTGKWGYDVTSAQFAERLAALTEGASE